MSPFNEQWSTAPEQRKVDGISIPNEIYLYIFDIIAPPQKHLSQETIKTLSNLSCVCRFFANICLPRAYERIHFSGFALRYGMFSMPQGAALSAQITAEQPLALALAGVVRLCHFVCWDSVRDVGSSEGRLYTAAMSHMKNIREVQFIGCSVDKEHWTALATLPSLEKLDFCGGTFLHNPAKLEPKIKVKVSQLCLSESSKSGRLISVIEMRYLRTCLTCYGDLVIANNKQPGQPWLYQPHFTDLHIRVSPEGDSKPHTRILGSVLRDAPRSLETLTFSSDVFDARRIATNILKTMSEYRGEWTALLSLRSLTLRWDDDIDDIDEIDKRSVDKLSQSINDNLPKIPVALRRLGPASSLRHVDYFGTVFHLADGEWLKGVL